jgi:hypothetical protein
MPKNQENSTPPSEPFGTVRNNAESFGKVPNGSEAFGKVRKGAESFRNIPNVSERKENHTLTVREAARMFETAGVARTERSIVNWCQPNKTGIARLDSYFDPNERKYFITPQSVELAIAEEKARAAKINESSELVGNVPKDSEKLQKGSQPGVEGEDQRVKDLEHEVMDLKITNRGKDFFIEQLQKERNGVLDQLLTANRKVGELETKLLQIESSTGSHIGGSVK